MLHPIEFGQCLPAAHWMWVPVAELRPAEVLLVFWLAERNVAACQ
jgi:hypothetical protein